MIYKATYPRYWEKNEYLLCKENGDYYVVIDTPNKKTHSWEIGDEFILSNMSLKLTPVSIKFYCNKFRGRG